MNDKPVFKYKDAWPLAKHICDVLLQFVDRVEIAGSLRRNVAMVHDIDLVAIEKWPRDLFDELDTSHSSALREFLRERVNLEAEGQRLIKFKYGKMDVDLYTPRYSDFGVQMFIRTGSKDFNKWVINAIAPPTQVKFHDGGLYPVKGNSIDLNNRLAMMHETDVFEALDLPYIPPHERHDRLWVPRWHKFQDERRHNHINLSTN
jgi:DNA polymerase (family 10)